MQDCVYCNIKNHTIESEILFENDNIFVIRDILPKAPVHLLIIPKEHIVSIAHVEEKHKDLIGEMFLVANKMGDKYKIADSGYELIFRVGHDGGQVIPHLHLHMLGGKQMSE